MANPIDLIQCGTNPVMVLNYGTKFPTRVAKGEDEELNVGDKFYLIPNLYCFVVHFEAGVDKEAEGKAIEKNKEKEKMEIENQKKRNREEEEEEEIVKKKAKKTDEQQTEKVN